MCSCLSPSSQPHCEPALGRNSCNRRDNCCRLDCDQQSRRPGLQLLTGLSSHWLKGAGGVHECWRPTSLTEKTMNRYGTGLVFLHWRENPRGILLLPCEETESTHSMSSPAAPVAICHHAPQHLGLEAPKHPSRLFIPCRNLLHESMQP